MRAIVDNGHTLAKNQKERIKKWLLIFNLFYYIYMYVYIIHINQKTNLWSFFMKWCSKITSYIDNLFLKILFKK